MKKLLMVLSLMLASSLAYAGDEIKQYVIGQVDVSVSTITAVSIGKNMSGDKILITEDISNRQANELADMKRDVINNNSALASEAEASQRYGYELR